MGVYWGKVVPWRRCNGELFYVLLERREGYFREGSVGKMVAICVFGEEMNWREDYSLKSDAHIEDAWDVLLGPAHTQGEWSSNK